MKRLALFSLPLLSLCTPAFGADLGPYYSERDTVIERPAPPRVVFFPRRPFWHRHHRGW